MRFRSCGLMGTGGESFVRSITSGTFRGMMSRETGGGGGGGGWWWVGVMDHWNL